MVHGVHGALGLLAPGAATAEPMKETGHATTLSHSKADRTAKERATSLRSATPRVALPGQPGVLGPPALRHVGEERRRGTGTA